ncbi:putative basic amino acid antiporter YfcC [Marivirga sp. S37H4]|uniref:Basic amino acid antiporter YfcC n=1 Tax=Marivirga aurantiaca TaxID=2802615 RepID=A0A934X1R3_9BACT|nr:TIGR00366 family protein [Marivirga aurantiaca]MBK6266886.1 putative basic amino acid antiporter YfcC [Marivirga aurantiaca]
MIKKLPDTLIIIFTILVIFTLLTWLIPAGEYQREVVNGREVIDPDSFSFVEAEPQGLFDLLQAPIAGFQSAAQIIAFILLVGGAFSIINATGAIDAALQYVVSYSYRYPASKKWILPIIITLFSLAGATFGMSEEVLVFILITIPLARALNYDVLVGVAIPFLGAGAGFAGAFANPFTIGVAQGIAELTPFSGMEYRLVVWLCFTVAVNIFILRYCFLLDRNRITPYHTNASLNAAPEQVSFTILRKIILILFALTIVLLIYGVNEWDWYINEIAALFVGLGIFSAVLGRLKMQKTIDAFIEGAKDLMPAALVVALSKGMLILATDGKIIDTILYNLAGLADGMPGYLSIQVMFLVQSLFNFFLPSGSGQAALTMPIMAPLSDLLGIGRQTAVLAFQFGDGISNLIIPTSGVTMGVLSIAKIPYEKWLKWSLPIIIAFTILAMLLLIPPVLFFEWA